MSKFQRGKGVSNTESFSYYVANSCQINYYFKVYFVYNETLNDHYCVDKKCQYLVYMVDVV